MLVVAKLVAALDCGSSAERREGSSPFDQPKIFFGKVGQKKLIYLFLFLYIIEERNTEIMTNKKLQPYTKEWLQKLCEESRSYNEVLVKAGRKIAGGSQSTLKKKIKEFGIDISHFTGQGWSKG